MTARSQEKRRRLEEALQAGVTMIHLDARRPGVVVPERFRGDYHLRLNLSLNFNPPDLSVNDWGVRETLSFSRRPFKIGVPWEAIFAISSQVKVGQAWLFPDDMPEELLEAAAERYGLTGDELNQLKREASETRALAVEQPAPAKRRFEPRLVEATLDEDAPEVPDAPEPPETMSVPEAGAASVAAPAAAAVARVSPAEAPRALTSVQPVEEEAGEKTIRRGHLRLVK